MWSEFIPDIQLKHTAFHGIKLIIALLLAFPVGWHREKSERELGFRTFPLVAVASTGYILLGQRVLEGDPQAESRLIQGLITGIGFLGGGAIVKSGVSVRGTATAASIWNTAAIGASVAYDRYEIALALSLLNFVILLVLTPVRDALNGREDEFEEAGEEDEQGDDDESEPKAPT